MAEVIQSLIGGLSGQIFLMIVSRFYATIDEKSSNKFTFGYNCCYDNNLFQGAMLMRISIIGVVVVSVLSMIIGCNPKISAEGRRYLQAADKAFRRHDDPSAIEACTRFIKMYPHAEQTGEAYYIRGLARTRLGKTLQGKEDFIKALELTKRKDLIALAHCRLGELAYRANQMDEAMTHYKSALKVIPQGASPADEAMYMLGCILQRKSKWAEADVYFNRVIYLFGDSPFAKRASQRVHARGWAVQAGALSRIETARFLEKKLRQKGLPARMDVDLKDGKLLYVVYIGSYKFYNKAQRELHRVRRIVSDAFITPVR